MFQMLRGECGKRMKLSLRPNDSVSLNGQKTNWPAFRIFVTREAKQWNQQQFGRGGAI
jgi:hypothetical protein